MKKLKILLTSVILSAMSLLIADVSAQEATWTFEIGILDRNYAEFAVGPDNYDKFKHGWLGVDMPYDPIYCVGISTPEKDWPFAHPGLTDDWGGRHQHDFSILFVLKNLPKQGMAQLRLDLLGVGHEASPVLTIRVNNQIVETRKLEKDSFDVSEVLRGHPEKGVSRSVIFSIPYNVLVSGANTITINSDYGSWIVYDRVAFRAAGAVLDTETPRSIAESYFKNGTIGVVQAYHTDISWDGPPETDSQKINEGITDALDFMNEGKKTCFSNDDMHTLIAFLQAYPERKEELARRIDEGRIDFGARFSQPMEQQLTSEMLARSSYWGRKYFMKIFPGLDTRIAFDKDVPQRTLQMAQVLKKSGIPYMYFTRFSNLDELFRMVSPDGSSVFAYSKNHYMGVYGGGNICQNTLNNPPRIAEIVKTCSPYFALRQMAPLLPTPIEQDYSLPRAEMDDEVSSYNHYAAGKNLPVMKQMTFNTMMERLTAGNPVLPVKDKEYPNIWMYEHFPTHYEECTLQRKGAENLVAAETFWTIRSLLSGSFAGYPQADFTQWWKDFLFSCHGWSHQVSIDMYTDRYRTAYHGVTGKLNESLTWIAERVKTETGSIPLVVFNQLSWERTSPVECDLPGNAPKAFQLTDAKGADVPYQFLDDGKIVFLATVPPIGYATYYLQPSPKAVKNDQSSALERTFWKEPYENDFYRIAPGAGGLSSVFDKELGRELFDVSKFRVGEWVELNTAKIVGASENRHINQPYPYPLDRLSTHNPGWKCVETGPVRTVFASETESTAHSRIRLEVAVYSAIKRIDLDVHVIGYDGAQQNQQRIMFPVNSEKREISYEVPYGIAKVGVTDDHGWDERAEHPREVQHWFSQEGDGFKVAISAPTAIFDYLDVTTHPVKRPLLQSVPLTSISSNRGVMWKNAGDHTFRYSITSHNGNDMVSHRFGVGAYQPLIPVFPDKSVSTAALPPVKSFCNLDEGSTVITALKKADDNNQIVVRLCEYSGTDTEFNLAFMSPIKSVARTNLIEEEPLAIKTEGTSASVLKMSIGHNAIETFTFDPGIAEPGSLTATSRNGEDEIDLSWSGASGAHTYRVEHKQDNEWHPVARVSKDVTKYTVKGLARGQKHTFRIVAVKSGKDQGTSNEASAFNGLWVWMDDFPVPTATKIQNDGNIWSNHDYKAIDDEWRWVRESFSGELSHRSLNGDVPHQHFFVNAVRTMKVNAGDHLVCWVKIDAAHPADEVMLRWKVKDGNWVNAYWGADVIKGWKGKTNRHIGKLPKAGEWVRLEVPASEIGLEGKTLEGMGFGLSNGMAWWDLAGKY